MADNDSKTTGTTQEDELLSRLVNWFEEADEAQEGGNISARSLQQRDIDYYDGIQRTEPEAQELRKRGQPDTTFNFIGPKIDFLIGLEAQNRADPKGFPRTPKDKDASEAVTDALRFVNEKTNLDQHFSRVWENMLKPGYGALEILIEEKKNGRAEIAVFQPDWSRVFYDPHSQKHDFTDARYMGYVVWWDRDEAVKEWPDKKAIIEGTISEAVKDTKLQDKPTWRQWVKPQSKRPRLRVATMYWQDGGQWFQTRYVQGGILTNVALPYRDDDGESVNPMIMQSAYVDRENNRYGAARRLIGPQDEENKRRSKLLHMLTVRQVVADEGAVDDPKEARDQLARPDGYIVTNPGMRFEILDQTTQAVGQTNLMQYAAQRLEQIGPSSALSGKPEGDPSGRAIIASQQGGIIELAPLTDRHRDFKKRVYTAIWQRIRQFWTEERWVRVTDNENNAKFVGFNRTLTVAQKLEEEMRESGMSDQKIQEEFRAMLANDPDAEAKLRQEFTENVAAEMDMDVILEESPDTVTIQQEQFNELVKIIGIGLPLQDPRMKLIIQASQLRDKRELIEMIDGSQQPSESEQQQQQIQMQTLMNQIMQQQADVEKTQSETEKNRAAAMKSMAETDAMDGVLDNQTQGLVQ